MNEQWQAIDTLPVGTVGDRVLAVVDGRVRIIAWGKTSHVPLWGWCLADQGVEDFDLCEPTLWMPLPSIPVEVAK